MNRSVTFLLLLACLLILITCSGNDDDEDPFKVAVVLPSLIDDLAFSQSMYDALVKIQRQKGGKDDFKFVYSYDISDEKAAAAALRIYADEGYDLIIAHGLQYEPSVKEVAVEYPKRSFAWGTSSKTFSDEGISNIFAYEANSQEGGYVNGVIAASLSKSAMLGVVAPIDEGDASLYVKGFIAGAEAINSDIVVNTTWTGSYSDVDLATEAARTLVDAGTDILTGSSQMVAGAISVADEGSVPWFGTQSSQTTLAPEIVVANQIYDWSGVLDEMITLIKGGTRGGKTFSITLANDGIVMDYNSDYPLPEDVRTLADETVEGIIDGSIVIPIVEGEYNGLTLDAHRVFVTEASTTGRITVWQGDDFLIGIVAADAICNMEASDAGLQHADGTNFVAWLSTTGTPGVPAINRLSEGAFIRTDKAPIAASLTDLTDGSIENPIWLKADGEQFVGNVRTATTPEGQIFDEGFLGTCSNWTSGSTGAAAAVNGVTERTDGSWTFYQGASLDCTSSTLHFYCFER